LLTEIYLLSMPIKRKWTWNWAQNWGAKAGDQPKTWGNTAHPGLP